MEPTRLTMTRIGALVILVVNSVLQSLRIMYPEAELPDAAAVTTATQTLLEAGTALFNMIAVPWWIWWQRGRTNAPLVGPLTTVARPQT